MQINVLPVSIPNRTGVAGGGTGDAHAFEDVLDSLKAGSASSDSTGASDNPPDTKANADTGRAEIPADPAVLAGDSALVATVPPALATTKQLAPGLAAGPLAAQRPGGWALQIGTGAFDDTKAGPADPDGAFAKDWAADRAPLSPSVAAPAPSGGDAPTQTTGALRVSAKPPLAAASAPSDGAASQPETAAEPSSKAALQSQVQPAVASQASLPPAAPPDRPASPGVPALAPTELTAASGTAAQSDSTNSGKANQAFAPAISHPMTKGVTVAEGQKGGQPPALQTDQKAMPPKIDKTSPLLPSATESVDLGQMPEEAEPLAVSKLAGQPSLTSAIQMLTRDDLAMIKGPDAAQSPAPGVAQILRAGYQEDPAQINVSQPRIPVSNDIAAAFGQAPLRPGASAVVSLRSQPGADPSAPPIQPKSAAPVAALAVATLPEPLTMQPLVTDQGTDGLRAAAGFEMLPLSAQPGGTPSFAGGVQQPATVTPQSLGQAIVQVLQKGEDRQIDLALRPEELGRLRFEMTTSGDKVHVILFIERPEALDLIRRHAEHLLNDLRQAGFSQPSLSFGDWSQRDSQSGADPAPAGSADDVTDTPVAAQVAKFSPVTAVGRLDIRL